MNMLVRLFECQCDVVGLKIMTRVPLAIQLAYLDGTTCALMKDLSGWLPSRPSRFESSCLGASVATVACPHSLNQSFDLLRRRVACRVTIARGCAQTYLRGAARNRGPGHSDDGMHRCLA